jgi:hypothetical protein
MKKYKAVKGIGQGHKQVSGKRIGPQKHGPKAISLMPAGSGHKSLSQKGGQVISPPAAIPQRGICACYGGIYAAPPGVGHAVKLAFLLS